MATTEVQSTSKKAAEQPWHALYPVPKASADSITCERLLSWIVDDRKIAGREYVLIDLRRTDFQVSLRDTDAMACVFNQTQVS